MNLSVDVISDVICPWCYIGKRRLEKAIARSASREWIEPHDRSRHCGFRICFSLDQDK